MKAKNFKLVDQKGVPRSLSDLRGQWTVVYFYPKDFTSGCTKEACSFQDARKEFAKLGAQVVGISKDTAESHDKFADKYALSFTLLSDPENKTAKGWGAYGIKNMYGKKVEGVKRSTFLIGPSGEIVREWIGVKLDGHVEQVVEALKEASKKD
jgi:thioredoxin-dependent peroxiredoxin